MRRAFIQTLVELATQDERILLLTGDLGYMALEPFAERFPDRFFNVGVAEQNMVGLAVGLAEAGYIPFVYSIATFAVLRPYEFIRHGPVLHHLPIRIVGIGGGFEYGTNGASHHALEDVGVMRIQPGMTVITPADAGQASAALSATCHLPGPVYYRVGKNEGSVPGLDGRFELGRLQTIFTGNDLLLIAMGSVGSQVVSAAESLRRHGVSSTVAIVSSVKPAPVEDLSRALSTVPLVLTVEAHYVDGGLGSLVAEIIAESNIPCRLVRCGVRKRQDGVSGSEAYLHDEHGLSADALVRTALGISAVSPQSVVGGSPRDN